MLCMENDGENDTQSLGLREIGFLYLNPFSEAHKKKLLVVHLTKRKLTAFIWQTAYEISEN